MGGGPTSRKIALRNTWMAPDSKIDKKINHVIMNIWRKNVYKTIIMTTSHSGTKI